MFFRNAAIGQRLRQLHVEIQKLALEDPLYTEIWEHLNPTGDRDAQRQHIYTNLVVSHWELEYELGVLADAHLREIAEAVFTTGPGRRYCPVAHPLRRTEATTRRRRRFLAVLDEAYAAANPGQETATSAPVSA